MAIYLVSQAFTGESSNAKFKNSIELLSFQQKVSQPQSAFKGDSGGNTSHKAEFSDIIVRKHTDIASTKLFQAAASGQTVSDVTFNFVRADSTSGGSSNEIVYQTIKVGNVLVANFSIELDDDTKLPTEVIAFRFTKIQMQYTRQNISGGQGGNAQASWNIAQNAGNFG